MTVVMAPPTMPMMRVSNIYDHLRARCWDQRHQERQGENSKRNLLHSHEMLPLFINRVSIPLLEARCQESNPTQVALNWARCNMAFHRPNAD
jgi:hypothetical protein